eukprot:scaffold40342_cov61-Attheya_sp.AAC.8
MAVSVDSGSDDVDMQRKGRSESPFVSADHLRAYLLSMATRMRERITMDTIRPLPLFLGVTGPSFCFSAGAFTPPSRHMDKTSFEKVHGRISLNFAYFASNYALLFLGVSLVVALSHPGMLLYLGMLWTLWYVSNFLTDHDIPIVIFGHDVGQVITSQKRTAFLTYLSVVIVIWKCLLPMLSVILISVVMILFHAIMRDPKHIESSSAFSLRSEDSDEDEEEGQFQEEVIVEKGDAMSN